MELLVPSLAALLFGIAIAFFVIPKVAPSMLFGGSALVLIYAIYLHYSKFGKMEYDQSSWQNNLRIYAKYAFVVTVFVLIYGFYAINSSGGGKFSGGGMDEITMPKLGGGLDSVYKTAASRMREFLLKGRITL